MTRSNDLSNISDCPRNVSIQDISEHAAMSDRNRILAVHEPRQSMHDVFRGIGSQTPIIDDIEPLALQAEINVLARHQRGKRNVHSALILSRPRIELDHLNVNLERQI